MVEDVVGLTPELDAHAFVDLYALVHVQVEDELAGSAESIAGRHAARERVDPTHDRRQVNRAFFWISVGTVGGGTVRRKRDICEQIRRGSGNRRATPLVVRCLQEARAPACGNRVRVTA